MHSLLRRTILCVALLLPAFAFAQTAETATAAPTAIPATAAPAAVPSVQPQASTPAAETAKPVVATSGKVSTPPEGKGQVVFFRPMKFVGAAIVYKVREGDKELGKLSVGKYFVTTAEPGTHVYSAHTEAKDALTLEVEAGETYFVQGTISMGFMAGHPNLAPSDQATFDGMAAKLKLAD